MEGSLYFSKITDEKILEQIQLQRNLQPGKSVKIGQYFSEGNQIKLFDSLFSFRKMGDLNKKFQVFRLEGNSVELAHD
jgi:hypothetical protein